MKLKLALGLLLSFWTTPALAIPVPSNNWVQIGRSPQGDTAFVDIGTLSRQGNQASYWMQVNQINGLDTRSYAVANCSNRTKSIRWVVTFDNGKVTANTRIDNPKNTHVTVATLGNSAYQFACPNQLNRSADRSIFEAEMLYRLMIEAARLAR
jgi:hypothetical protein